MLIKILATIHLEIFVQGLEREAERGGREWEREDLHV
jgi:hypothetical protein